MSRCDAQSSCRYLYVCPEEWNNIVLPELPEDDGLVAYVDFTDNWTHKKGIETLDPFDKLLLAACRGGDDPRLLS